MHKAPEDEEAIWADVKQVAEKAVDAFIQMRETEGQRLYEDVMSRAETILNIVGQIEERSPETVTEYRERLEAKLREVLNDTTIDEQRILTEAAIFADKVAVAEETVRLRSHFDQLKAFLSAEEPSGRKMDFLVQEMNREANTIGSKASDSKIAYMVVDIKAEIEKDPRADPEHRVRSVYYAACEHRLWQHDFRRAHDRHCQPGIRAD